MFAGGKAALMTPSDPVGKSELPRTPVVSLTQTPVLLNNLCHRIFFTLVSTPIVHSPVNWTRLIKPHRFFIDFPHKLSLLRTTMYHCLFSISPETGSYVCEFCGKQYKYFNPYQEHVALHTPMGEPPFTPVQPFQIVPGCSYKVSALC